MSLIAINTSQNVNVEFTLAGIGDRIVAFIVDMLIKIAYIVVLFLILFYWLRFENYLDDLDQWSAMAVIIFLTLPVHIYTLVCESLMEGQTFGKKALKIKVVKIDGYQAGFSDYMMRWVFRLVDIYSNSGIVGVIFIITSKNNQRLGDMASGTAVISLKSDVTVAHTIIEELKTGYAPVFPQVVALSDGDVRIIKENFQKASHANDQKILKQLTEKVKDVLKIEILPDGFSNRAFLDTVIKDYNFYTGKD